MLDGWLEYTNVLEKVTSQKEVLTTLVLNVCAVLSLTLYIVATVYAFTVHTCFLVIQW